MVAISFLRKLTLWHILEALLNSLNTVIYVSSPNLTHESLSAVLSISQRPPIRIEIHVQI